MLCHYPPRRGSDGEAHTAAIYNRVQARQNTAETHLNSSLIESWGSKTEQTQAQSGSEPNQNCLIFAYDELGIKEGGSKSSKPRAV